MSRHVGVKVTLAVVREDKLLGDQFHESEYIHPHTTRPAHEYIRVHTIGSVA